MEEALVEVSAKAINPSTDYGNMQSEQSQRKMQSEQSRRTRWSRSNSSNAVGIHAWALVRATQPTNSCFWILVPLLISVIVVAVQLLVLTILIYEGLIPRCTIHDHGRLGEWCVPLESGVPNANGLYIDGGFCYTCHGVYDITSGNMSDKKFQTMFSEPITRTTALDAWFERAADHCIETDIDPGHCDHFVINNSHVALTIAFTLFFTVIIIMHPILSDIDQAAIEALFLSHRLKSASVSMPKAVLAITRFCHMARSWVLPPLTLGAMASLLLSGKLASDQLILNGLAIGIVASFDDVVVTYFLRPEDTEQIREELDSYSNANSDCVDDNATSWASRRIVAFGFYMTCACAVLAGSPFTLSTDPHEHGCNVGAGHVSELIFYAGMVFFALDLLFRHWGYLFSSRCPRRPTECVTFPWWLDVVSCALAQMFLIAMMYVALQLHQLST